MSLLVLFLGKRGGGMRYFFEVSKELVFKRPDTVFVVSKRNESVDEIKAISSNVIEIDTYSSTFEFVMFLFSLRKLNTMLTRVINEHNVSLVYSPMTQLLAPFIIGNKQKRRYKYLLTLHDDTTHQESRRWFKEILLRSDMSRANNYIILSKAVEQRLLRRGVLNELNYLLVPHGAFRYDDTNLKKEVEFPRKSIVEFVFFGRIEDYKGLNLFLEAIEYGIEEFISLGVRFCIYGQGELSKYRENLDKIRLSSLDFSIQNRWIAESEISSIFNSKSVCVLPYLSCTQSGLIPLAFNYGVPCIATRVGGLVEQLSKGGGILLEGISYQELSSVMIRLARNETILEDLKREAKILGKNSDNWSVLAEGVLTFMEDK
jgi:glycosyltransferase involved in cell wall biosynthesis